MSACTAVLVVTGDCVVKVYFWWLICLGEVESPARLTVPWLQWPISVIRSPASEILVLLSWVARGRSHALSSRLPDSCTPVQTRGYPQILWIRWEDGSLTMAFSFDGHLWTQHARLLFHTALTGGIPTLVSLVCFRNNKRKSSDSGISHLAVRHFLSLPSSVRPERRPKQHPRCCPWPVPPPSSLQTLKGQPLLFILLETFPGSTSPPLGIRVQLLFSPRS